MHDNKLANTCEAALFWMLLSIIAWLPIPFGSNQGWSWSLMELLVFTVASGVLVTRLIWPSPRINVISKLKLPLGLLIIWLGYHLIQVIPLPYAALAFFRPASIELYRYLLGGDLSGAQTLSLDVNLTLQALLKGAAYITLFLLVVLLVNNRQRLRQMAMMLVYVGVANAFFGLINYFTNGYFGYFNPASPWGFAVTGTYINRNHFAGLMEMCIPIALGLILALQAKEQFYPTFKARLRGYLSFLLSSQSLLYLFTLVMLAALLLSTSRGGIFSLLAALTTGVFLLKFMNSAAVSYRRIGSIIILFVVLVIGWFGLGNLESRLKMQGLEDNRSELRSATYSLIKDYPLIGTGAGTYEWIFPLYKTAELGGNIYEHAHNDYLELLVNQGGAGLLTLGISILLLLWRILKALNGRRDPLLRGLLFGVVCGVVAMLTHALVDFNFQIPANAAIFWCLLGVGVSCALMEHRRRRSHQ